MLHLVPDREGVCLDSETILDLLVRVTPPRPARAEHRPELNLSLVLDRSGSMQGEKMEMTRKAAGMAVRSLRDEDRVSVVLFDEEIETLVPCTKATAKNRIADLLSQVEVRGCTNLCDGWRTGAGQASLAVDRTRLNRVLVLTDGQANRGETDLERICSLVRQQAEAGVQTTTLGFGPDYNEVLLRAMAASGEGNHFYVETPEQLARFFEIELDGLAATQGTQVHLRLDPLVEGLEAWPLADMDRNHSGDLKLADLVAGCPLEVLVRLRVPALRGHRGPLLRLHLIYRSLATGRDESLAAELELPGMTAHQRAALPLHPEVAEQVASAIAAVARKEAMEKLYRDDEAGALKLLRQALQTPSLADYDARLLNDLVATIERGDHSSGHKKASMHGHGHARGSTMLKKMESEQVLDGLISRGLIPLQAGPLLASRPCQSRGGVERMQGMMLGLVFGESLGQVRTWGDIFRRGTPGAAEGSLLALATLECLADEGELNPNLLAQALAETDVPRPSQTLAMMRQHRGMGKRWTELGSPSAGCGALRRIAPVLALHYPAGTQKLWSDVALGCLITHRDTSSLASCLGFAALLWDLTNMAAPPHAEWYCERFLEAVEGLETDQAYQAQARRFDGWSGKLSDFVRLALPDARQRGLTAAQAMREWGSGPYLLELVPSLLYVLERHAANPTEALRQATKGPLDPSSLGALVGVALGALHGPFPGLKVEKAVGQRIDRGLRQMLR